MNTIENDADLIISIPCCWKTTFHTRTLFVYEDHLVMQDDDNETIVFSEKYRDMLSLNYKHKSNLLKGTMELEMMNGNKYEISLDARYNLEGKRVRFNPEINQISKTLPTFINKLIKSSKHS